MGYVLMLCSVAAVTGLWAGFPEIYGKRSKKTLVLLLLSAVAGSALFGIYGYGILKSIRYLILIVTVIILADIDHEKMIIPNKILLILLGIRAVILIGECIENWGTEYLRDMLVSPLLGFLFGGGIFLFCYVVTRKGIGAGDVKLFAVIGSYVGMGVLFPIMLLAAIFTAGYGGVMVLLHKLKMTDSIPFGPFVAAGTVITLLLGF